MPRSRAAVQITITGEVGSGRTTLAMAIGRYLHETLGVQVNVRDNHDDVRARAQDPAVQQRAERALRGHQVLIQTQQIARGREPPPLLGTREVVRFETPDEAVEEPVDLPTWWERLMGEDENCA